MSTLPTYSDPKTAEGHAVPPPAGTGYAPQAQPVYQTPAQTDAMAARGPRQSWKNSFWSCFTPVDLCCMSYWCPCIVFGKTQQRLVDPRLEQYETLNNNCLIWYGLSCVGVHWIIQMIKRNELRERFNIEGSQGMDCFASCCCPCCELMQSEKEVRYRLHVDDTGAAPQGYQKNEPMVAGTHTGV